MSEVLTHIIKKACAEGRLRGVSLPGGAKQQNVFQYVDDFFFMVRGDRQYVEELMRLHKVFSEALGMEINLGEVMHLLV